ncbi:MAG: hypothetical protein KDK08_22865, partial [Rhizobiaceae bacterium]|nr:hypothetical protein [Rhizobiaceae bacterium]
MIEGARRKNQTFVGKRKRHDPVECLPLLWPRDPKAKRERLNLFDAWRNIAAQILDDAKEDFRLLSAVRAVFIFHSGEIVASNRQIALEAGHCADKTITRYVKRYADLGLFIVSFGNRFDGPQMVRTRT